MYHCMRRCRAPTHGTTLADSVSLTRAPARQGGGGAGRACGDLAERGGPVSGLDRSEQDVEEQADRHRQLPYEQHHHRQEVRRQQHVREHGDACADARLSAAAVRA